ncbi:hypothetical protein BGZ61DRAFT_439801 [Ilyonectria robusta]|uniref:uncharacterized protein n=1 Tax=Ilyonectria robusta TaxID=1079257 RepID=UPI001E8D72E3|nr:uncharacterized protein BGZ61DRAFT_439801 [Ilyonectria robusta]KAH8738233.1 hypothetical protein BGZ61DRAFT_439801 [Ilyonectria robusta]
MFQFSQRSFPLQIFHLTTFSTLTLLSPIPTSLVNSQSSNNKFIPLFYAAKGSLQSQGGASGTVSLPPLHQYTSNLRLPNSNFITSKSGYLD